MNTKMTKFLMTALLALGVSGAWAATTQAELNTEVSNATAGATVEITAAGTYKVPGISKNITIKATVDGVVFDCVGSGSIASIPNGATFENAKFTMGASSYHGFQHAGHIVMKNCTIEGLFFSYGDMTFDHCTFNQTASEYSMWAYAGDLAFNDCTIECNGKFVNVYNEGNNTAVNNVKVPWTITATGCEFHSTKKNKAAFNVKAYCNATLLYYNVKISNCTIATPDFFPAADEDKGGPLWVIDPLVQIDDRKDGKSPGTKIEFVAAKEPEVKVETPEASEITPEVDATGAAIPAEKQDAVVAKVAEVVSAIENNKAPAAENTGILNVDETGFIKVTLDAPKVLIVKDAVEVKSLVFDVTPFKQVTVGETTTEQEIPNREITQPITFRLPLPNYFTISAIVKHEGDPDRLLPVKGENGGKYVEVPVTHFSAFEVEPSNEVSTTVESSTVLGIKRRANVSGTVAIGVPWLGTDGQAIKVKDLISKDCLVTDDKLLVWNGTGYDAWKWSGTAWEAFTPTRGVAASIETPLVRGKAAWLERAAAGSVIQIGQYNEGAITTTPEKGASLFKAKHSLLINPKSQETSLSQIAGAEGDQIVILTSPKVRLECVGGQWGTTKNVFNPATFETEKQFTEYTAPIPADTGFWYISAGGAPVIQW